MVNASLDRDSFQNTISTLRYGDAAASIKNKPTANVMKSAAALRQELTAAQMLDKAQMIEMQGLQLVLTRLRQAASDLLPRRVKSAADRDELFRRFPALESVDPTLQFFRLLPAMLVREVLSFCPADVVARTAGVCTGLRQYLQDGRGACDFWVYLCRRDFEDWSPPVELIRGDVTPALTGQVRQQYYAQSSEPYMQAVQQKQQRWEDQKAGVYTQVGSGSTANAQATDIGSLPTRQQLEHDARYNRAAAEEQARLRAKLGEGGVKLRPKLSLK